MRPRRQKQYCLQYFYFFLPAEFLILVKFNTLVKFLSIIITNIYTYIFFFIYIYIFLNKITLFTPLTIQYSTYSTGIHIYMNLTESGLCSIFPKPVLKENKGVVTQIVPKTSNNYCTFTKSCEKCALQREASLNYS